MAIKINLLPQSYDLEKKRNRWIAGMTGLLGVTALSIGLLYLSDQKQLEKVKEDLANATTVADKTTAAKSAAANATSATASIKGVVDFMTDASKTGRERAALLDMIRRYIYRNAVVSDLDLSTGNLAKIAVTIRSPDEYARFLLALRQGGTGIATTLEERAGKVFEGVPKASGIPGFPNGRPIPQAPELSDTPQPITFPFPIQAEGNLKTDTANPRNNLMYVPAEPPGTLVAATSGAAGGGGGAPGGSSYPGSSSGSGSGYPGSSSSSSSSYPGSSSAAPSASAAPR